MPGQAEQILKDLKILQDVETQTEKVRARSKRSREVIARYQDLRSKVADISQIDDRNMQDSERRILTANLQELRDDTEQERKDLAQAYMELRQYVTQIDVTYEKLRTLSPDEQALIDNAKAEAQAARDTLAVAKADLEAAQQKWFFKGRAIRRAKQKISAAEARISEADQGIVNAEAKAKEMNRQRLQNESLQNLLLDFTTASERAVDIMADRLKTEEKELQVIGAEKVRLLQDKEEASAAVKKLEKMVNDQKQALAAAEQKLAQTERGPAWDELDSQVQELRKEVQRTISSHNAALTLYETCENFAQQAAVHEDAHEKLRGNLIMWITALREETKARKKLYDSRLLVMQAASDQEVAKMHDDMGAEEDIRSTEHVAAVGAASDRMRLARFQDYPRRIQAIHKIAVAQVKAQVEVDTAMQEVYADVKDRFGIDPFELSFVQNEPAKQ